MGVFFYPKMEANYVTANINKNSKVCVVFYYGGNDFSTLDFTFYTESIKS